MVLSNKKLKQKLRKVLAKSSADKQTDVQNDSSCEKLIEQELNPQSQIQSSFKDLLESSTGRPRLSKREKRRTKASSRGSEAVAAEAGDGDGCGHDAGNNGKQDKEAERMEGIGHLLEGLAGKTKKKKQKRNEEKIVGDGALGSERTGDLVIGEESEKRNEKKGKKRKKQHKEEKVVKIVGDGELVSERTGDLVNGEETEKRNERKGKKRKKQHKEEEVVKSVVDKGTERGGEEGIEKEVESNDNDTREGNGNVPTKVYVGGIPYYSTEDDIRSYFEGCGTITGVDCMMFPETGNFRGISIISFKTEAAAKRALALDGADMGGLFLKIQPYKTKRTSKTSDFAPEIKEGYNRVYVGNLPWDITEDELKSFFSGSNISSIRFGMDKETGNFKGFAHTDFSDKESLTKALKLDQKLLSGRNVVIRCAVPLKKASNNASSLPLNESANNYKPSSVSGKMRRRTCFVCKQKGHESSSCPSLAESTGEPVDTAPPKEATSGTSTSISGKARRRTCLLCRQKGHESSTCPTREENS